MYTRRNESSLYDGEDEFDESGEPSVNPLDIFLEFSQKIFNLHNKFFDMEITDIEDENSLKHLELTNKLYNLLNSQRNFKITQTLNYRAFCVHDGKKNIFYSGLRERLKKNWWPTTEENPFKRNRDEMKQRSSKEFYSVSKRKTVGCKSFGAIHGSYVHKQMELFTNSFMMANGKDWLAGTIKIPDICTLRIISLLNEEKWIPVASEFKIWDEDWRVATSIDMIVIDSKKNEIVILEFKCGYEGEEYGQHPTDSFLPEPFQALPNCPLVRHMFQLLGMKRILERKYGIIIEQSYIIRLCPKMHTLEKIGLCNWCLEEDYILNLDYGMEITK